MALDSGLGETIFDLRYSDTVSTLSKAASVGDLKSIRKFISCGKLPQTPDNRGWTSIHRCVESNQIESLKLILKLKSKDKKYLVNLKTWENETPLLIALASPSPSLEIIKILLRAGANPKSSTHTKLSPLHLACRKKGNAEIVKLLIRHGADANAQEDLLKLTPLHLAVIEARDAEMIDYLMRISDLSLQNAHERTAFLEACFSNFAEAVKLFLDFDKELVNKKGNAPPLVYSAFSGNLEMTKLLLCYGANVNLRCTALVSDLSSNDSDFVLLDVENYLPVHSALKNVEIFKLLLKLTSQVEILKLNFGFCDFPLFVLIYSEGVAFYEALLESDLPEELKMINCERLKSFFHRCSSESVLIERKFNVFFKYNFHLEPENVFAIFIDSSSTREVIKCLKILHRLSEMEIPTRTASSAIKILEEIAIGFDSDSDNLKLARITCDSLRRRTSSLRQLCRVVVRRHVRALAKSDWLAYKAIDQSILPNHLKKYLLFDL